MAGADGGGIGKSLEVAPLFKLWAGLLDRFESLHRSAWETSAITISATKTIAMKDPAVRYRVTAPQSRQVLERLTNAVFSKISSQPPKRMKNNTLGLLRKSPASVFTLPQAWHGQPGFRR